MLIEPGADLTAQNNDRETSLHPVSTPSIWASALPRNYAEPLAYSTVMLEHGANGIQCQELEQEWVDSIWSTGIARSACRSYTRTCQIVHSYRKLRTNISREATLIQTQLIASFAHDRTIIKTLNKRRQDLEKKRPAV
jgi:hypothetical protein